MRTTNRIHRLAASLRYTCHVRRKSAASSQPAKASRPVKLYSLTAEQNPARTNLAQAGPHQSLLVLVAADSGCRRQ